MIKERLRYVNSLLLCTLTVISFSQTDCTVPLPPLLTNVSINPVSGNTELKWNLSPSLNIDAYLVYIYSIDDGKPRGDILDTIWNPSATSWSYYNEAASFYKLSYVVSSFRKPKCGSQFSNNLNTIYCSTEIDTCRKELIIKWNQYLNYPDSVMGYSVFVSKNGNSLAEISTVNSLTFSYIYRDFEPEYRYCFVVRANLKSGLTSASNKSCINVKMQRTPGWINADYATVNEKKEIDLSFTIDPMSEIKTFSIERAAENDHVFSRIALKESLGGKVIYTDPDVDLQKKLQYRASAINNCGNPVVYSNISGNMVLSLTSDDNILCLGWNSYPGWLGGVEYYKVFMNTGDGFTEKTLLLPVDTVYSINYSDIMYDINMNELCFYIIAYEHVNLHNISGESRSNTVCTDIIEKITVPNAFTPDNDLINDFFRPVLSFTPVKYQLIISDRRNNIIFETTDHLASWDGSKSGSSLAEGVYIWYLKVATPSGKTITKSGTVTIIKSR